MIPQQLIELEQSRHTSVPLVFYDAADRKEDVEASIDGSFAFKALHSAVEYGKYDNFKHVYKIIVTVEEVE